MSNKGSTLIEALFAFMIFCSVLVGLISLQATLNRSYTKIQHDQASLNEVETVREYGGDLPYIIEKVLRS
ncbi:hypothetical protein FYJ79_02345 [Sharpea azabuensis]|uniref:Uncharacterized protein n=1 Tax=Sharpea porci TaxID=2652286 RepID=A0A844FR40_9FIRM|nr:hypothetical protein [Sharpea porci]MDY5278609.1 hypothetical protein [Sharpea porci]MST88431.1 hypothetical protein [Sharpea porci]